MKPSLSDEVKRKESGDVAKSTMTPTRRQPTRRQPNEAKTLEDKKKNNLQVQGVQKIQQEKKKLNVVTVSNFTRVVDSKVKFSSRRMNTATLQEDDTNGRQPVAQDNHCSRKNTSTEVQAVYENNPQEIAIPKTLIDDMSALLPSSALFFAPQKNLPASSK